jgi:hypothetical protein
VRKQSEFKDLIKSVSNYYRFDHQLDNFKDSDVNTTKLNPTIGWKVFNREQIEKMRNPDIILVSQVILILFV